MRAGRGQGILAAADLSVVETSLAGFPATAFLSPPPLTDQSPRRRFSLERPQGSRKEAWDYDHRPSKRRGFVSVTPDFWHSVTLLLGCFYLTWLSFGHSGPCVSVGG